MTSKEVVEASLICNAVFAAYTAGHTDYESALRRIQDPDMLNRDLGRRERNIVRDWFSMYPEVTETERCA